MKKCMLIHLHPSPYILLMYELILKRYTYVVIENCMPKDSTLNINIVCYYKIYTYYYVYVCRRGEVLIMLDLKMIT